jgi:hypothetical protein
MTKLLSKFTNEAILNEFVTKNNTLIKVIGFCYNIRIHKQMIFVILRKEINTKT